MRIIAIASGKGGTGKTFFAINLATALSKLKKSVTLIDANFTTPNTALTIGYITTFNTIHDFLSERIKNISNIIYSTAYGFRLVPGSIDLNSMIDAKIENFAYFLNSLRDEFIILDTAAGIGKEALFSILNSNEVILVVNPEISSLMDAKRVIEVCERIRKKILAVVANRVSRKREINHIQEYLNLDVNLILPEDRRVKESIEKRKPYIILYPSSYISTQIMNFASFLAGELMEFKPNLLERIKYSLYF